MSNPNPSPSPSQADAPAAAQNSGLHNPLSLLTDLESRISGLKQMHEQTATRERELAARELELIERQRAIEASQQQETERRQELETRAEQLNQQSAAMRAQQESLQQALAELASQKQAAASAREEADRLALAKREDDERRLEEARRERENALVRREEDLKQREHAVAQRDQSFESRTQEIQAKETGVAQREKDLTERDENLKRLTDTLNQRDRSLKELTERIEGLESELDSREASTRQSEQKYSEREKWLLELETSVNRRKQEAEETSAAATALENELSERDERLSARERDVESRERASAELAVRQQVLAAREEQVEAKQREVRETLAQIDSQRAEIMERERALAATAASEQTSAIYAGRAEDLQLKLGEASAARARLETELTHAREELAQVRGELKSLSARPTAEQVAQQREASNTLQSRLEEASRELESSHTRIAELQAQLEQASGFASRAREADDLLDQTDRLKRELGARDEAIVKRDEQIAKLKTAATELEKQLAEMPQGGATGIDEATHKAELDKREQAILVIKKKYTELKHVAERTHSELQQQKQRTEEIERRASAAQESRGAGGVAHAHTLARRERLRAYKRLLQSQARKIVAAQAALQKRHADCEQILSQRPKIVAAAENIARREKKLASAKSRNGTLAALAYTVATLGLLAGLSWEVSRRVWPGTFVARATVEADANDRRVAPEQVTAWQKDMESLLQDARLMEVVAERMKRRGFEAYSSAADVRSLVNNSVYTQSSQAGQLQLELRSEGEQRTQLLLDTLVTAFKSIADESKGERSHDLGLRISSPAASSSTPLWDQRIQQAGMVFGGSVLGTLLLGSLFYSRLAAGKRAFDAKSQSEIALNDVDWAAFESSMNKSVESPTSRKAA